MKNSCQRMPHPSLFPFTFNPGGGMPQGGTEIGNFLLSFFGQSVQRGGNIECVGANSHSVSFLSFSSWPCLKDEACQTYHDVSQWESERPRTAHFSLQRNQKKEPCHPENKYRKQRIFAVFYISLSSSLPPK